MPTPVQSFSDIMDRGIDGYRNREFREAIECLQQVLDFDPQHWRAKLYLAMSFYHSGEIFTAYRHFVALKDNCTDAKIKAQAEAAMDAMNSQVNSKMPEMTSTFKKADIMKAIEVDDGSDLEWVDTSSKGR